MKKTKFLSGKKIYLRALTRKDLGGQMLRWSDDAEVTHYMVRGWRPSRIEELEEIFKKTIGSNTDIEFAICLKSGKHIGVAGLHAIDWLARSAEYRIMIGEKSAWSKGYGAETANLLVSYAFEKLNLNRVWLGVNASDKRAIASYQKSGFKKEGIAREVIFRNNRYYDGVRMSILRREYKSKK